MSHLGQRLSALIDDELGEEDRDRVLMHLAGCESCRGEAIALRTLKRRMGALAENSALTETGADTELTGRLMSLAGISGGLDGRGGVPLTPWSSRAGRAPWPDSRPGWLMLGGAFSVFLAGLGTAAFLAGGGTHQPEPEPRVTPAVDVLLLEHEGVAAKLSGTRSGPATRRDVRGPLGPVVP